MSKEDRTGAPPHKVTKAQAFAVAAGGSVRGKYRILEEGTIVAPDDFDGGQADIDHFVERGAIVPATAATAAPTPEKTDVQS